MGKYISFKLKTRKLRPKGLSFLLKIGNGEIVLLTRVKRQFRVVLQDYVFRKTLQPPLVRARTLKIPTELEFNSQTISL